MNAFVIDFFYLKYKCNNLFTSNKTLLPNGELCVIIMKRNKSTGIVLRLHEMIRFAEHYDPKSSTYEDD
jgi:hypothetical protein